MTDLARRSFLEKAAGAVGSAILAAAAPARAQQPATGRLPISGLNQPALAGFDEVLATFMTEQRITTDASLGPVVLHDDSRKVALIAPADINSPDEPRSDKHVIVYHPAYRKGIVPVELPAIDWIRMKAAVFDSQPADRSRSKPGPIHDINHLDPVAAVAREYAGRWIAGFAPVRNTGFVVVVQQRFHDAMSL